MYNIFSDFNIWFSKDDIQKAFDTESSSRIEYGDRITLLHGNPYPY